MILSSDSRTKLDKATPRELLEYLTALAFVSNHVNKSNGHLAPAKGPRGLKRRAKKSRLKAHRTRMARVTWCAYGEQLKREAA